MVSNRNFFWSAIAALACLLGAGCGGDAHDPFRGVQNRPPIIDQDSLRWWPNDSEVRCGREYIYTVKATDPDIGDAVTEYHWRFGDDAMAIVTYAPNVNYTFAPDATGNLSVRARDNRGAIGPEAIFSVPLSWDEPVSFELISLELEEKDISIAPGQFRDVTFEFRLSILDSSLLGIESADLIWEFENRISGVECSTPVPSSDDPRIFRFSVKYQGSVSASDGYGIDNPTLKVKDASGHASNKLIFPTVAIHTMESPRF